MHRAVERWSDTWYRIRRFWMEFEGILGTLQRCSDLRRLIRWAARKRLPGPLACYRRRLQDEEQRLLMHTVRNPGLSAWARGMYWLRGVLIPPPHYYRRGAAAPYAHRHTQRST